MTKKKVDLVHYINGERVVIGKAVVSFDGQQYDITASITHDDTSGLFEKEMSYLSIGLIPKIPCGYCGPGYMIGDEGCHHNPTSKE